MTMFSSFEYLAIHIMGFIFILSYLISGNFLRVDEDQLQSRLLVCLQFLSESEKFWQYWMLLLVERQRLKLSI